MISREMFDKFARRLGVYSISLPELDGWDGWVFRVDIKFRGEQLNVQMSSRTDEDSGERIAALSESLYHHLCSEYPDVEDAELERLELPNSGTTVIYDAVGVKRDGHI